MNITVLPMALMALSTPAPGARLAYDAPANCPDRAQFSAAVSARGAEFAAGGPRAEDRVMVVSITREGDGYGGAFYVRDSRGATGKREVHGQSCAEVTDALAIVTAIALRPGATESGGDALSPASSSAPPEAATVPAPPGLPAAPTPPPPTESHLHGRTRAFPPRTETVHVGAGELRFDLQRNVALFGGAASGLVPGILLPRYDLALTAANFVTTPEGGQHIAGLVLQLRVGFLGKAAYQSVDTKTDIYGMSFGIGICQSPVYDTRGLVLLFCAEYGGGYLNLTTTNTGGTPASTKKAGFGQASIGMEAQYTLGAGLYAAARVAGGFTVGQLGVERDDGSRIFQSSPWSASALLGVGFRF